MNRTYEIMFIVRPDVEEAELDKLIEGFSANVTNGGGEVKSVEKMGRRRLAYTVRKFNDGFYVLLTILAEGKLITEIERRLRVSEQVIKFITVRMDEEEKRLAKVKRSAQPIQQQPVAPVAAAPAPVAAAPVAETKPEETAAVPVFWGRGTEDAVITDAAVARTQEWLPGHSNLTERIYERLAHGISADELNDIVAFFRDGPTA